MATKKKTLNKIEYDGFIFVEDGTVYNPSTMREIAKNPRSNGHRYVSLPSGQTLRLEYLMIGLFVKKGKFPEKFDLWDIDFSDGDTSNCAVSNLVLIERDKCKRGRPKGSTQMFCLIDLVDNDWDEMNIDDIAAKLDINKSTVRSYGLSNPKRIYKSRYIIGDFWDVWENVH